MALDGLLTGGGQRLKPVCAGGVTALLACPRQQFFHSEHQGVEVHGHDAGRADGAKLFRIVHPAGAKVPSRGRGGTQVTVDLGGGSVRVTFGGIHIVKPGLRARGVAVIPVAVEDSAVVQLHHALVGLARLKGVNAVHPVGILFLHLRTVFLQRIAVVRRQQFHHQREERRLGAAQVIAAVAVGNMAEGVNLIRKVIHHIADFAPVAALRQAQHGEIAVPVVNLAEAAAGDNVRFG